MSLVKWNRNNGFPALSSMIDNFFNDSTNLVDDWRTNVNMPAVNISEEEGQFKLEVAVPGIKKEDLEVEVTGNLLKISAEQKNETEETEENYTRKEFSYSSFYRSFRLPETVDANAIDAKYQDGILNISLPKLAIEDSGNSKTIAVA